MRRKRYIVQTTYKAVIQYEILAETAEKAKQMVREGLRSDCIDIVETFNVDSAVRKESK